MIDLVAGELSRKWLRNDLYTWQMLYDSGGFFAGVGRGVFASTMF